MSDQEKDTVPACFDGERQATERLTEMFVGIVQKNRLKLGQKPATRAVFRKLHGVAHGWFETRHDLPDHLKEGLFSHQRLPAWVRFSSDTSPTAADTGSTLGIGIKLFGVPGMNALGEDGNTADFIMQNFNVFFVDNAEEMCAFTYAGVVQGDYPSYLAKHPKTNAILNKMAATVEGSVLTTTYWALLPFHLGRGQFVKYRLEPETAPQNVPNDASNYLATDLTNRLARREYRFRFMVQLRTNPGTMPLDQATVEWPESESPFIPVATLVLPRQDVQALGQADYGQGLAYNIWRVPQANAPAQESSIAVARKTVYAAGADVRHTANGQPLQDPTQARPALCPQAHPHPPALDGCIVKAVVYPPIGVARVGNSHAYFFGPEVVEPPPQPASTYRDNDGALKRQAARFRLYGVNAKGQIVKELTASDGTKIEWSVHLANQKAAWYGFQIALDIPEASSAAPSTLRNAGVADRSRLVIDGQQKTVAGANAAPQSFNGSFMDKPVYLGEIFTDTAGRLVVLGGHGQSASYDGSKAITFGNNEGWHDDVSDGPVTARVTFGGKPLEVVPGWVVVAPPNYAPQRKSVRTLWDLMRDVAIQAGTLPKPDRPSFTSDILPIFQRLNGLQWVNAGFAAGFGWNSAFDFASPTWVARLADNGPANAELRKVIANQFRVFDVDSWSPVPWPWLYGDAMSIPAAHTPRQNASLTNTQLAMLKQWAAGDFVADYDTARRPPQTLDEVPLVEQGDMLTRAALDFCLADAFHPGCEMTWPVRASTMYMAPFRFAHAPDGWVEPGLGEVLSSDTVTIPNGPLYGQVPGGITRWMAVPWQTDTASCRSGYDKAYDPYVPSFWPARVPNQVLTQQNYAIVMDEKKPLGERMAAFANRAAWIAPLGTTSYTDQINNMIQHFDHLGVVVAQPGPKDGHFPSVIEVEDQHKPIRTQGKDAAAKPHAFAAAEHGLADEIDVAATAINAVGSAVEEIDLSTIEKVRRFPGGLRP